MPIAQNLNLNGKLCLISNRLFFDVEFPPIVWEIFTQYGNMWNDLIRLNIPRLRHRFRLKKHQPVLLKRLIRPCLHNQ